MPHAAPPPGFRISATMQPVAPRAAAGAAPAAEVVPVCATPVAMRWRYYPGWLGYSSSTVDPEADPPEWPYVFESFALDEYSSVDAPIDAYGFVIESADTINFTLTDYVVAQGLGWYIIDLIDADGKAIDMRANYALSCFGPDANENPDVIEWVVRYVQFDLGSALRAIPSVWRLPSGELLLIVNTAEMNAGTLTISATDNWSPGAPQAFGPLTFVFGEPE